MDQKRAPADWLLDIIPGGREHREKRDAALKAFDTVFLPENFDGHEWRSTDGRVVATGTGTLVDGVIRTDGMKDCFAIADDPFTPDEARRFADNMNEALLSNPLPSRGAVSAECIEAGAKALAK